MIDTHGIRIPASLVPHAFVDYDMEAQQILGFTFPLPDGFEVPPLTAAMLVAMELAECRFVIDPQHAETLDAAAAIVLMRAAIDAPETLFDLTADPKALRRQAAAWLSGHARALSDVCELVVRWICEVPFYGYFMRPGAASGGGRPKEFWFDGAFAGGLLAPAAKALATPVCEVMWHTPLCLVWHTVAQQEGALTGKPVDRPPDLAALDRLMEEAAAREDRGELHPWQIQAPDAYGLTERQVRANPALIGVFAQILSDHHAVKCSQSAENAPLSAVAEQDGKSPAPDVIPSSDRPGFVFGDAPDGAASMKTAPSVYAVADPSGARNALPTITVTPSASAAERTAAVQGLPPSVSEAERTAAVQDLSWGPPAERADFDGAGACTCCRPGMRAESITIHV